MTREEKLLFEKLDQFKLDDPGIEFPFSDRLARDNGWTRSYTMRVIEEYKKFIFLCSVTDTGITPSDPVDQAWHLHLTYTRSYWVDLCKNVLGKEIHHNPTKGGKKEAKKFEHFYFDLHRLYKEKFLVEPPADIWHDSRTRFTDIDFKRINLKKYWIIKKPRFLKRRIAMLSAVVLFALISIQAFDVPLVVLIIVFGILGVAIFRNRGKGGDGSGCSTSSCGYSSDHGSHGNSGCGSGCSGCSGSGCSGCGGGGD